MSMKRLPPLFLTIMLLLILIPLVHADVVDSNPLTGGTDSAPLDDSGIGIGQCFKPSSNAILSGGGLYIRQSGISVLTLEYRVYATTGSYGSACVPTGAPLASSATFSISLVGGSFSLITGVFSGANQIALTSGTAYAYVLHADTTCCPSGGGSGVFLGVSSAAHSGNSLVCEPTCTASATDLGFTVSGTTSSTPGQSSQCYGNCGTLANTNSTHLVNFNSSITLFYAIQSNLNGFVLNVSTVVAKSYTNGMILYLGLYRVDASCTASAAPFTPTCPGFIVQSQQYVNPAKGTQSFNANLAVVSGQWLGIAVSGSFAGLDLNDTSVTSTLYQTAGIIPGVINSYQNLGSSKLDLRAYILGLTPGSGGTPTTGNLAGCNAVCWLVALASVLGGGDVGGIFAFGIVFGIVAVGLILLFKSHDKEGRAHYEVPESLLLIIGVIMLFMFAAAGVLSPIIPVVVLALTAWLFASTIHKGKQPQGG